MNYKESAKILEEVKKAKKILVNCHRGPDADSVGSATAMAQVLEKVGKEVSIITPSVVPMELLFLEKAKNIQRVDFSKFDFMKFDLFICMDSSTWGMVTDNLAIKKVSMPVVVIDHHLTNDKFGKVNLVDASVKSTGEILYLVFEDWGIKLNKSTATSLLTGILGDTGVFQYPGVTEATFKIAMKLMSLGADKDGIVFNTYRSKDFAALKFLGEILRIMKFEKEDCFVWSAIPYSVFKKYEKPLNAKEWAANEFTQSVEGTNFGLVMVEKEAEYLSVSIRSRTGVDISTIASELGGGGHKVAAGVAIRGLSFDDAVNKVLEVCRKYAKKFKKV